MYLQVISRFTILNPESTCCIYQIMDAEKADTHTKRPRLETDYSRCIICQGVSLENVISKPKDDSINKLLNVVNQRAGYGENEYVVIKDQLQGTSLTDLNDNNILWHKGLC